MFRHGKLTCLWAPIPSRVLNNGHDGYIYTRSRWSQIGHWFKLSPDRCPNGPQPQFQRYNCSHQLASLIAKVFTRAISYLIGWPTQCRSCERAYTRISRLYILNREFSQSIVFNQTICRIIETLNGHYIIY